MNNARITTRGIVETIATISIVGTLIVVVLELSANERAIRSATASDVAQSLANWYIDVGVEEVGGSIFWEGMRHPELLSEERRVNFMYLMHGAMLLYQNAYVLGQEGTLDSSLQAVTVGTLSGVRHLPGFKLYWHQRQSVFTKSFRDYVNGLEQPDTNLSEMYE